MTNNRVVTYRAARLHDGIQITRLSPQGTVEHEFVWQHHAITSIKEESEDAETTRSVSTCVHERGDASKSASKCDSTYSNNLKHMRLDDHSFNPSSTKGENGCCVHMDSMRTVFHEFFSSLFRKGGNVDKM